MQYETDLSLARIVSIRGLVPELTAAEAWKYSVLTIFLIYRANLLNLELFQGKFLHKNAN